MGVQRKHDMIDQQELAALWREGKTLLEIAEHFGCPEGHISQILYNDRRKAWAEGRETIFPERINGAKGHRE